MCDWVLDFDTDYTLCPFLIISPLKYRARERDREPSFYASDEQVVCANPVDTRRNDYVIILRPVDVTTSFWHNNNFIITLYLHWDLPSGENCLLDMVFQMYGAPIFTNDD